MKSNSARAAHFVVRRVGHSAQIISSVSPELKIDPNDFLRLLDGNYALEHLTMDLVLAKLRVELHGASFGVEANQGICVILNFPVDLQN